jgi:hypothetical protein
VGRWIVTAALWALAGGLFAGRTIAAHVDRGVEVGMDWLAELLATLSAGAGAEAD